MIAMHFLAYFAVWMVAVGVGIFIGRALARRRCRRIHERADERSTALTRGMVEMQSLMRRLDADRAQYEYMPGRAEPVGTWNGVEKCGRPGEPCVGFKDGRGLWCAPCAAKVRADADWTTAKRPVPPERPADIGPRSSKESGRGR